MTTPDARDRTPLVTVCIPTTGRTEYVDLVFRSLREQTHVPLEVLVLDNASPPASQEVLHRHLARVPGARVLRTEERLPMFVNFNRGIQEASGRYIVFFHDDDIYLPQFIERHVTMLEARPAAAFAGGNFDVVDKQGQLLRRNATLIRTGFWPGRRFIEDLTRRGRGRFSTPGIVYRSSVLKPLGFDEEVSLHWGDFALQMRMAEDNEVAVLAETHLQYRVHGANASGIPLSRSIPMRTAVMLEYCRGFRERHPMEPGFAARLERHVARTHRRDLAVGWLTATDAAEAEACLRELRRSDPSAARLLELAGRLGLSRVRGEAVGALLRRIARRLRI